ncbi:MAG: CRISPR-associated endonuclease Cas1 [Methylococcus sp.]
MELRHEGQYLCLYEAGNRRGTVPLNQVDRVVMRGRATITTGALGILAEAGVALLVLSGRQGRSAAIMQGNLRGDTQRRIAQYAWYADDAVRVGWSRLLVALKLRAQAAFLRRLGAARPDCRPALHAGARQIQAALTALNAAPAAELSLPRLNGIEGAAAAAYFAAFTQVFPPSLNFTGRNRRPPRDPVNAALSLAYTLLHFEAVQACQLNGLDPYVGFYHEPAHRRESLAADLIEPLRVHIDRWVWRLFADRELRAEDFVEDNGACLLKKEGRALFYARYETLAPPLRRLLRRYGLAVVRRLTEGAP